MTDLSIRQIRNALPSILTELIEGTEPMPISTKPVVTCLSTPTDAEPKSAISDLKVMPLRVYFPTTHSTVFVQIEYPADDPMSWSPLCWAPTPPTSDDLLSAIETYMKSLSEELHAAQLEDAASLTADAIISAHPDLLAD